MLPPGVPLASNLKPYFSPFTNAMSFIPTITSQGLLVFAGTSTHNCPSISAGVTLPVPHQLSKFVSNALFFIRFSAKLAEPINIIAADKHMVFIIFVGFKVTIIPPHWNNKLNNRLRPRSKPVNSTISAIFLH